jgi:hypothetical protein
MPIARILRTTGLAVVLAVLAVGPFLRGLFFWTELLASLGLVAVGCLLWLAGRGLGGLSAGLSGGLPAGLSGGLPGAALLALLGVYLVQFAWAVYPRGNLDWTLRVGAALLAYVMLRAEAGPALRRWLGWLFVLSAVGVGLLGFAEFTGYLGKDAALAQALSLVGLSGRMFTTFQYPNTAAAYFLAAMLAAAGLGLDDLKPWKLSLTGGLMTFLALAFFFTVSRGALVVLPFGLALFFLGLERGRRWPALLLLLIAFAGLAGAMKGVGVASAARHWPTAFRWLGAATAGGAVAGLALGFFLRLKIRWQAALAGAALLLAVAGFLLIRPAGTLLPKQATRLLDINFKTVNVALRLIYDQDALQMAADRPLGRGGWGWDRGYRQYQAFNYTARETHDHYAQTAVEAGWLGLAVLLTALAAALWAAWQSRRNNPLGWSLAAGAGLIAAHSAIDFNLSFGVIWLLLWCLLAAGAAPAAPAKRERALFWAGAALAGALALVAGPLFLGSLYADRGDLRQAVKYDPLQSEPLLQLGDRDSLEKAARLDPFHSGIHFQLAIARELQKDYQGAYTAATAALEAQPQVSAYYTKAAELAGKLMTDALHNGRLEEARHLAGDLVQMGAGFTRRKAEGDALQKMWSAGPKLEMAPAFQLRYGQALYLKGDEAAAVPLLKAAGKVGLLGSEAHVWLYAIYEKRGDTQGMKELQDKPWIRFKDQNPVYKALKTWQPG